jgi:hypothetical protein
MTRLKFEYALPLFSFLMLSAPVFAQSIDKTLCMQCLTTAKDELRKCLDAAISQEDKKSCRERQETHTKTCENECKIERAAESSIIPESQSATNKTPGQ